MGWRWRKSINVGGGILVIFSRRGIGWSWGIPGFRIGISADGSTCDSVGISGTELYFIKRLDDKISQGIQYPKQAEDYDLPLHHEGIKDWKDLKK